MNNFLEKKWAAYTFATCSAVVLYMLLSNVTPILEWFSSLWQMLTPVVIGFALAYMIDPLPRFFERRVFFKVKNMAPHRSHIFALGRLSTSPDFCFYFSTSVTALSRLIFGQFYGEFYTSPNREKPNISFLTNLQIIFWT